MSAVRPTGEPLVGDELRLELLRDDAVDELFPLLSDPFCTARPCAWHNSAKRR